MADNASLSKSKASQIVSSARLVERLGPGGPGRGPIKRFPAQQWAPAWFFSALNWLGKPFIDGNDTGQQFGLSLFGSDVDPYAQLGSTRLFVIKYLDGALTLQIATAVDSTALTPAVTRYPMTDAGVTSLYNDLATSPVFAAVRYAYIPGRSAAVFAGTAALPSLSSGYDPASGLRVIVDGSAVVQAVPLADFMGGYNEQVYDEDPQIVPIVSSLVYDVTQNNTLGARTFSLPVFYSRDSISGAFYVNKFAAAAMVNGAAVQCGQTAVFQGGPGYDDSAATQLTELNSSVALLGNHNFRTYNYSTAEGDSIRVESITPLKPRVDTGVCALTYSGASPSAIFANQAIVGFYANLAWPHTHGIPIYDYGTANGSLTSSRQDLNGPSLIYGTGNEFLNGGSLQNVLQKLAQAKYLYSADRLVSILDIAISAPKSGSGVGLSVTTAALDFAMSSSAVSTVANQLTIPILATVTTTPPQSAGQVPTQTPASASATTKPSAAASTRGTRAGIVKPGRGRLVEGTIPTIQAYPPIGAQGNAPSPDQPGPTTVQVALAAVIPQAALGPTDIGNIEIGTVFPTQSLGDGTAFHELKTDTVLNLMATAKPALPPFKLDLKAAKVDLARKLTYTFSLLGDRLSISGPDGFSTSVALPDIGPGDPAHTFVGMATVTGDDAPIALYPLLPLSFPAPAVGTHGVVQETRYSLRLAYGRKTSIVDLIDDSLDVVASGISVESPKPADGSRPQPGDLYFGSFYGGAATVTVWSVPVFLRLSQGDLAGASLNGGMTLGSEVSGLPAYELSVTDSSLFVYSNIDVDTSSVGSLSAANVYLASAVINSAPDDHSAKAFAPARVLMGLIRQVRMGAVLKYVFIPEDDSVVIGGVRYLLSVINLAEFGLDPNTLPYPPAHWPDTQFWQFANRHNPYLEVQYAGQDETVRRLQAALQIQAIGKKVAAAQEPMQLYLDTALGPMTVWPILAFPYASSTQSVDQGRFSILASTIFELLSTPFPAAVELAQDRIGEKIVLPAGMAQNNPYTYGVTLGANPAGGSPVSSTAPVSLEVQGKRVTNLAPGTTLGKQALSSNDIALKKSMQPQRDVVQERLEHDVEPIALQLRQLPTIYGFSVYNPATGEAYLVEVVNADQEVPDQIPYPTTNTTYDPYYVRVVFLRTMTAYNMSIIVPSMARDQFNYLGRTRQVYENVLARTDDLRTGYMAELWDGDGRFDSVEFHGGDKGGQLYTHLPYAVRSGDRMDRLETWFICRRQNWRVENHLMRATHPENTIAFMAFGAGDLVPMQLDGGVAVDQRQPPHMVMFSHSVTDQAYDSVRTFTTGNVPYFIGVTTAGGVVVYTASSLGASAGVAGANVGATDPLDFPPDFQVVGQASTTLTPVAAVLPAGAPITDTSVFANLNVDGTVATQQFQLIAYNSLVYLVRAVTNVAALGSVGGATSGLLIDTYVPTPSGTLELAQAARFKQSGLQFFGSTYTPTTMIDTLDRLDFTSITGETFYAPTIFVPIPELDASKGFIANLSDFLGQKFWTFIYPEIVARPGETVNGSTYPSGYNLDPDGKPILSLQKLHFVYDPIATLFTPNDLTHKYALQPKQQVLALTNGQIREGICWRSANPQYHRLPPQNVCAQEILPDGIGMDRTNIIYASKNRPVFTSASDSYMGMSVNSVVEVSGCVYNIEESAMQSDQTGSTFISQVSSISNLLIGVLFDYDNNEQGTLAPYDPAASNKGLVFLNGYLSSAGFTFSSADHFDVDDILECQVPMLNEIANILGQDVAFNNIDASLPEQFWSLAFDAFTAPGLPNYIAGVPPAPVDPTFSNRTRSLVLNMENKLRPDQLGIIDTYSSVVSANLHLANGITGAIFLGKKADRDIASIGSNPAGATTYPLAGLPTKYDFFIFSRDHYATLQDCEFELVDQGYAMCLVDDGTGTNTKVAQYLIDTDGNYNELYTYVLYSPSRGILEAATFTLKVTLGSPANLTATPPVPATPNSVNPQDLAAQINKSSNLIYAAFGPSSPGQPAAFLPIQNALGEVQATPIFGAPGFNGYNLNVVNANRQPVQISQIHAGSATYVIAGQTTIVPINPKTGKAVPFYGSLSHGLDKGGQALKLQSADLATWIPRPTVPAGPPTGSFGGNGQGALIRTQFSRAFQGSGAIPPAIAANPTPGTTMKADDTVFYTFNAVTNGVTESTGKSGSASGTQFFIDETDPANPIYGVASLPKFTLNGNTYSVNVNTSLSDGTTSRYTLVAGGKSYLFDSNNQVTVDRTRFNFGAFAGGIYPVTITSLDAPSATQAPTPIALTPFSVTAGGATKVVDVFNDPGGLDDMVLGVTGRLYTYDPIQARVTVAAGATSMSVPIQTGLTYVSSTFFAYVIGFVETAAGTGAYTVNGALMFPYNASASAPPASYPIMTAPRMFSVGGDFYTFDQDMLGNYLSVTGAGQAVPVNPYQFSLNGEVYIINTNVQPNTVVGGGATYPMRAGNTQFDIAGVQYTITPKAGSLNGATVSGQFDIAQANVVVLENYVYELDIPNGQIVGNGLAYPLLSSGFTYQISTANQSYTVTTQANATTVTIGNVVYQINDTTVVGDGITYPILPYRTFQDGAASYQIGYDGTANIPTPLPLVTPAPPALPNFSDGATNYTVNAPAAFDGTNYFPITGSPPSFTASGTSYQLRNDGVAMTAGPLKTYIASTGALQPNQFQFGAATIFFGRATDIAAFDGVHYYAIANNSFTDSDAGLTFTLSGNTAVNQGNSYEIFSNLGQTPYFQVPGGKTYLVNVAVADTGTPTGTIFQVFPMTGTSFTALLQYTITVSGATATVSASSLAGGTAPTSHLTATAGRLTGGYFQDPVTNIVYTCVVDGASVTFVDSNNTIYPLPSGGTTGVLSVGVVVATGQQLALSNAAPAVIYAVANNQFSVTSGAATTTYVVNPLVAYSNAAGPYFPITNGRFIVAQADPVSDFAYTIRGGSVIKGFAISEDDEFSPDGHNVYAINAVNVAKAFDQATLAGSTLTNGSAQYTLDSLAGLASRQPTGLDFAAATHSFEVSYGGTEVTYTLGGTAVTDDRHPSSSFPATFAGSVVSFTDTVIGVTFNFDSAGNNPVTARFVFVNDFFIDPILGVTYYIDPATDKVEAIAYLPETTQYAFTAANGVTYLIHYSDVQVVFPVVAGQGVNAGVATVGTDIFTVIIDEVDPTVSGSAIPTNKNSFEINGNLYAITGTPVGSDYSSCQVVGDGIAPLPFLSANTFRLTDPNIVYTLHLDAGNLPETISATFPVLPSRDLISVNDDVYLIAYTTVSTGSLLGQGSAAIPITGSAFKLTNAFDKTSARFVFDDLDIFDAGSVEGQFTVYLAPTFFLGNSIYTLHTDTMLVTDSSLRPYPLIPNPTMFGINGFNYVIDTNRVPHAIIGNHNVSPLSTDITILHGVAQMNPTFTLNGQIYAYVEDAQHNLLAIRGTKLFPVAQPALTFKLDSSLIFTILPGAPAPGGHAGTVAPIGLVTAGTVGPITSATTVLNLYAGTPESGGSDYFMYKNVLYTLIESAGVYTAVQKTYTVYASAPAPVQQQLAVFDLGGTTCLVTDGTTAGAPTPAGINPGTMWSQTATSTQESQFGLVYGFAAQPTNVTQAADTQEFQFAAPGPDGHVTLYNILYTRGDASNMVQVNVPDFLPSFMQTAVFDFYVGDPLMFETGGYNAFTAAIGPTAQPEQTFAGAFRTPLVTTDTAVDTLMTANGDFTLEFWNALPQTPVFGYHPVTYRASTDAPLVYYVDVDFKDDSTIFARINNTILSAQVTPPAFSTRWQHFALTYSQPFTMVCKGAGYEVKDGTNYNFNSDFSIALTFAATDVQARQGLVCKGAGGASTAPYASVSYAVEIFDGNVILSFLDGNGTMHQVYYGPQIQPNTFYQVIVVKNRTTPATGTSDSTDPYDPPFDPTELASAASSGGTGTISDFPSSGTGALNISGLALKDTGTTPQLSKFMDNLNNQAGSQSYTVTLSLRVVNDDGTFGDWQQSTYNTPVDDANGQNVLSTGNAHLLIGASFLAVTSLPLGSDTSTGNIRNLYLFNSAIDPQGIRSSGNLIDIAAASPEDLANASILGYWPVKYDPNGVVANVLDSSATAVSTNASKAFLAALSGHEYEGASLYLSGYPVPLALVTNGSADSQMPAYQPGSPLLAFRAGDYRLEEIAIWSMCRAQYQVLDDMFGRLLPENEPFLSVYLSGEFSLASTSAPALPMNKYLDGVTFTNLAAGPDFNFTPASLDLIGSPYVGRCGPLITPNLYTTPGDALTVADTPPMLTSYSVTLNTLTGTLAGEINEAYVYVSDSVLKIFAGKKVGDLTLTWVSQEQGDVQVIGYIEGAPPAPMANLTNKASYAGATSVTLNVPTSVTLKYTTSHDSTTDNKLTFGDNFGINFGWGATVAPFGFGMKTKNSVWEMDFAAGDKLSYDWTDDSSRQHTASIKLDESFKYTVKMQGALAPYTGDQFMANLNTISTPSTTPGTPGAKSAILPNPNLGGFTASNPPGQLPKSSVDEKFGQRMFMPSPYGQAFVTSTTLDVYQQTLVQSKTTYGFIKIPNAQIPRDLNIVSFRMNSQYIRPGCLDGMVGYVYNPATLPNGTQTYATSSGQMSPLYDGNFPQGQVGHSASYMRVVEAYRIKKQIDLQAFTSLARYNTINKNQGDLPDPGLTPALDFYDEYVWSSRGATQEVKHTYTTTYEEVTMAGNSHTLANTLTFNMKIMAVFLTALDFSFAWDHSTKDVYKYTYTNTATSSFDITSSFDGIETDTQMRFSANNDAHFVMNFNSTYNPGNQSGIDLVIGSDGLVYQIVPSTTSGAGLPLSNNLDNSQSYSQPQPSYTTGNATGLTGNLEPYDRPGKTSLFRTYAFFIQPTPENADTFWSTVVDPVWLKNSPDADADALRTAQGHASIPWRLLYRVTHSERFLPPISSGSLAIPQITPIMAVPVLNPATDFLFKALAEVGPRPALNPANDIEANIVLVEPTMSGLSVGLVSPAGSGAGLPVQPNNVIPFDLVKPPSSLIVNWGDSANARLLGQMVTSALGLNVVPMVSSALPGSTLVTQVKDPVTGAVVYAIYNDPNGLTINVPTNFGVIVYQDVNGNPIQYYDGQSYRSLQADYVPSPDGTVMHYVQPPSTYDQSAFNLMGDYDLFNRPGDEWRYFLVSGMSSNMTSQVSFAGQGPFLRSAGFSGFHIADSEHGGADAGPVQGYVLAQGILQYPNLNTNAETFADLAVYKSMALLDTFPIGDPVTMRRFLGAQYPQAPFADNEEIGLVFARNIMSYFNTLQQALLPQ